MFMQTCKNATKSTDRKSLLFFEKQLCFKSIGQDMGCLSDICWSFYKKALKRLLILVKSTEGLTIHNTQNCMKKQLKQPQENLSHQHNSMKPKSNKYSVSNCTMTTLICPNSSFNKLCENINFGSWDRGLINEFKNLYVNSLIHINTNVASHQSHGHENLRLKACDIIFLAKSLFFSITTAPIPSGKYNQIGKDDCGENVVEKRREKPDRNKYSMRSHTCGELGTSHVGQEVRLVGWIEFSRMNKFILLRDSYGKIQLIIPDSLHFRNYVANFMYLMPVYIICIEKWPYCIASFRQQRVNLQNVLKELSLESVVAIVGTVCRRPPGQENPKQKAGAIEVSVTELKVLNKAKILPFYMRDHNKPNEFLRLKYRYLDLRSQHMQNNLRLRSKTVHEMRRFLIEHLDFVEVETPTLFKRTPGGAQEFIVPTKTKGKFYSLVQSPQQFKQLLMIGSIDRYFQIARCYRDETARPDRQPEFTQLDLEMSFCEREDILNVIEELLAHCWPKHLPPLVTPLPRMSYEEAMNSYGTDKPDLRFHWKLKNLTESFYKVKDKCPGNYVSQYLGMKDLAIYAFVGRDGGNKFTESVKKKMIKELKDKYPLMGFLPIRVKSKKFVKEKLESLFHTDFICEIEKITKYEAGDVLFLAIGEKQNVVESLGKIRLDFAHYLEEESVQVFPNDAFTFAWILDFPLFEMSDGKIVSAHHPFTQPHPDDVHLLETHPLKVKSLHYDLILNGIEVGGGSMRVRNADMQKLILENILDIESTSIGHLLDGLASGAPPHGGIALGLDRLFSILCGTPSIRDVIAFPKAGVGTDAMSGAPDEISNLDKIRYHIKI